jgi:eukaryotic-like serine/threonine-protein kinase
MLGTVVGNYRVLQRLGQGGVGAVYRVEHTVLGTSHALKVLMQPNDRARQRLLDEGRIQATLRHPNIVAVRDVIDVMGHPGLLMDLVEGPTLARLLSEGAPSQQAMGAIGSGILFGMAAAHRIGLVHRDLKPANVLLAIENGVVVAKIADFGLARLEDGGAGMTSSGASLGTPRYMAPEQVRDPRDVDASSDVWALGAMLYELCAGIPAFEASDLLELYNDIGGARFVPLKTLAPGLPEGWLAAVDAAMRVRRSERPADAEGLAKLWGPSEPWVAATRCGPSLPESLL